MADLSSNPKQVLIICGATATGKSALAIQAAQQLQTSIISCDSRQCYREMNIGVAKPSKEDIATVPHYFINSHSVAAPVNAAAFESYALTTANAVFSLADHLVMAGGTGLYIRAFEHGMDPIPTIDENIRQSIMDEYMRKGLDWLQSAIAAEDPIFFESGEIKNPQRLMRALEVVRGTGQSIRRFQQGTGSPRTFRFRKIGIDLPKDVLHDRINARVDQMMADGLLQEVESLISFRHLPALRTVGYAELFEYLDGKLRLAEAVDRIRINTRQYAKRQLTWFRRDKSIQWFSPETVSELISSMTPNQGP